MAAAAEIRGNFAHIHIIVGAHADLIYMRFFLVNENGALDSFRNPELINNTVQIIAVRPVKIKILLFQCCENAASVHKQEAF